MSLTRKTYSPMSHTYSYSSTLSPTYSYSRVTTYLDALERDQQINKLKRQITTHKSIQMKYHSLLQQIAMAEKQNYLLETRNSNSEKQYVERVQKVRGEMGGVEKQVEMLGRMLEEEERNVEAVEREIQGLLEELKGLKKEEEDVERQNVQLEGEVKACDQHLVKLSQEQQQIVSKKSALNMDSKQCTKQMQNSLKQLTELNEMITKYEEQLKLLKGQSQCFQLQCHNMSTLCAKNTSIMQNLQRKVALQQGENQQLRNELAQAQQQWQRMQSKFLSDKQNLYQNVINVEQQSLLLKDTLNQLNRNLQKDSTQKKYLKDISTKHTMLLGQNEEMRKLLKHLQEAYNQKKAQETSLIEEINGRLRADELVKAGVEKRTGELTKIRQMHS